MYGIFLGIFFFCFCRHFSTQRIRKKVASQNPKIPRNYSYLFSYHFCIAASAGGEILCTWNTHSLHVAHTVRQWRHAFALHAVNKRWWCSCINLREHLHRSVSKRTYRMDFWRKFLDDEMIFGELIITASVGGMVWSKLWTQLPISKPYLYYTKQFV